MKFSNVNNDNYIADRGMSPASLTRGARVASFVWVALPRLYFNTRLGHISGSVLPVC